MATPTSRTLALLRREGWSCQVVERWCAYSRRRIDLFGIIDVVGVKPGEPVLGIQCTSGSNAAARRTKALATPGLRDWLASGHCTFEVWSWSKRGGRWCCRRQALALTDLPDALPADWSCAL
jgi:hypothetical protein